MTLAQVEVVTDPTGAQLHMHRPCRAVEWWHPVHEPAERQGCDNCESAPDGAWMPLYLPLTEIEETP